VAAGHRPRTCRAAQVFVISREKIQQRGYETLFKYMTVNNARTTIGRSVLSVPKRWQARRHPAARPPLSARGGPALCRRAPAGLPHRRPCIRRAGCSMPLRCHAGAHRACAAPEKTHAGC
jgi:hypothetical protein